MTTAKTGQATKTKSPISPAARIGLFGGTFNPLHLGHTNAITTVHNRLGLEKVMVIPAAQNPRKAPVEGPTNDQRMVMLTRGLEEFPFVEVDEQEILRGGPSYTVETVREYAKEVSPENLFLIVGVDQFEEFDKWKNFEEILTLANLVVVTRPNHNLPFSADDLPEGLKKLVTAFDRQYITLTTDRAIEFVRLQDLDVSATDVRKRLRGGLNVDRELSIPVEEFIREENLYAPIGPRIGDFETFTNFCAQVLFQRKGLNVRGFDLRKLEGATEYTLIASGTSTRHASSLAESVLNAVKGEFGVLPQAAEGIGEGRWVVLDYGSLIIHLFYDYVRQEYRLEDLWKNGRDLLLKEEAVPR